MTFVALGAFVVLVYTYFGYPLLVGLLARLRPMRLREDAGWTPKVSAVIPVFNAAGYVRKKVASLLALDWPADKLQILLYSDGSTDDTNDVIRELAAADPRVVPVLVAERKGKPSAVNAMLEKATGEVLLMTDVRQPLVPGALRALTAKLADPSVACVSGNLVLTGKAGAGAYWRYENWIRTQEGRFRGMVGVTGPIYAIRKVDMAPLPQGIILDDMWVPMRLRLEGRRIVFAPDAIATDDAFADDREFGRKVRTLAGNYQLFGLLPRLLVPFGNPSWLETFSHKVLRLVCPWALVALLVCSTAQWLMQRGVEPASVTTLYVLRPLVGGQAAFYFLAILGRFGGRFGTLARTFVVLNYAAVVGLWRTLRGSQKVTW